MLALFLLVGILGGCELRLRGTTIAEMDRAEAVWQANPVADYHMVTEVRRPDEVREYEVMVRGGEVVSATMKLYDMRNKVWWNTLELNERQAFPFTVPGMFDTVRGALRSSGRTVIRVEMGEDPPFPIRIELGPVWDRGQMVRGTESEVRVRLFERLVSD
ncbi:MAG: hypothetical protein D6775_13350 [Caldilineae bacterium]|nr:MAG: hypothetical protein D6775_13350 [Caldilineae bacterium]